MSPADEFRTDTADLERELTALESRGRAWSRYKALRDGPDDVVRLTPQERAGLDALLEEIR